MWQRLFLCRGRETRGGLPGWGNKTLPHWAAHSPPRVEEDMLNFERIFRHGCRILVTKILVSDFPQFYGEASPQVVRACTRLCMFPSLSGRFFATSGENRCTFLFDHLWTKKRCQKWQRRIMLRSFSEKSEKLTANIFDLRPHEWVCLKRAPRNDLNPG